MTVPPVKATLSTLGLEASSSPQPAPGPADDLYVMPEPRTWARIPSWEWHRAGVDHKRSSTILRAVRVARRLEEAADMAPAAARARLELIPGIGPWTSAEVVQRSHGAPDEVTVGDLHLPGVRRLVAGEPAGIPLRRRRPHLQGLRNS